METELDATTLITETTEQEDTRVVRVISRIRYDTHHMGHDSGSNRAKWHLSLQSGTIEDTVPLPGIPEVQ
jgi:hypothetical protein